MSSMNDDDDDTSESSPGKYPVMPSLVALQQMRNRLHLAHVGKKLMKWTAMATGRDLRRIAQEMIYTFESYKEDVGNAYMTLARARYFYPNLNNMVTGNFPTTACVYVKTGSKSSSGVRVIQLEIIETENSPYEHLGIEKGGQAIKDAKQAWLDLLRRMIIILQLRTSFLQVEIAHKNATKRQNVLQKIVIPRIIASIKYILLELEELAREELYRIKMVKVHNMARAAKKSAKPQKPICQTCAADDKPILPIGDIPDQRRSTPDDVFLRLSSRASRVLDSGTFQNFDFLKNQLNNIISIGKGVMGGAVPDKKSFPRIAEESGSYVSHHTKRPVPRDVDGKLIKRLDHLKAHLREVIDVTREFRDDTFLTPSVENFVRTCEQVDNKLNIYVKSLSKGDTFTEDGKNMLNKLKGHIGDVARITQEYKCQGLLTPSVENFLKSCDIIVGKIDAHIESSEEKEIVGAYDEKLDELKQQVVDLENFTCDIKKEGITSSSIEDFLASCKDFKLKLDSYKKETRPEIKEALKHLNETIQLSKEAKDAGLVSASVDTFIETCEETKKLLEDSENDVQNNEEPKTLEKLAHSIEDVVKMIAKYEERGLANNVDELLKACEVAKTRIDMYRRFPLVEEEEDDFVCSDSCICGGERNYLGHSDDCPGRYKSTMTTKSNANPTLKKVSNKSSPKSRNVSNKSSLKSCNIANKTSPKSCNISNKASVKSCDISNTPSPYNFSNNITPKSSIGSKKVFIKEPSEENFEAVYSTDPDANSPDPDPRLGCFVKKTKMITRINRSQNEDGTITEEKVTTTIRREKYDPSQTDLSVDDLPDDVSIELESYLKEDEQQQCVLLCHNPAQGLKFLKPVKSEHRPTRLFIYKPMIKWCQSADGILLKKCIWKKNVLEKVIVPRIVTTIHYILSELEEKEREEIFRLKRFKQLKMKHAEIAKKAQVVAKPCVSVEKPEEKYEVIYEEPIYEEPIYEEPIYEEPIYDEPIIEESEVEIIPEPIPYTKSSTKIIVPIEPKPEIFKPIKVPESVPPVDVCCSCLSVYEVDPNAPEPTCPVCKKAIRIKEKQSKAKLNLKPCESTAHKKQLEDLTTHIDEVINLSKKYKMEGIVSPSIEKFIETCNTTKEKIEDYANASVCGSMHTGERPPSRPVSATGSAKSVASRTSDKPEVPPSKEPPSKEPPSPGEPAATESAEELGYFESKYKEVVKVTRLQNEDGTISEERQVITVKTERKNPRKPDTVDGCFGQQRFIGSCTCHCDVKRNLGVSKKKSTNESIETECEQHFDDRPRKNRPSRSDSPRKTKSEQLSRCQPVAEPRLRACLSVGPKSICGDASFTCKTCLSNVSSKEIPIKAESCAKCSKCPITTSVDSVCCLKEAPMICTEQHKRHESKASLNQPVKAKPKIVADKSTCCCDYKILKVLTTPVSIDAATSTTDFRQNLKTSCASADNIRVDKKKKMNTDSCCRIKIIIKPQKPSKVEEKRKDKGVGVTNSLMDTLNRLLPCHDATETKRDWSEIEDLCLKCLSKLHSQLSTCTICQDPPEDALEIDGACTNCLSKLGKQKSCQEKLEVLFKNGELCEKCVSKLKNSRPCGLPYEKCHTCKECQEKIDEFAKNGFCSSCMEKISKVTPCRTPVSRQPAPKASEEEIEKEMSEPSSYHAGTSVAVDTSTCGCSNPKEMIPKHSKRCLSVRSSKASVKSECCGSCAQQKDASTLTKRCNRFDVRPIRRRHTCDASLPKTKSKQLKKSHSFHEKDYHYFRK